MQGNHPVAFSIIEHYFPKRWLLISMLIARLNQAPLRLSEFSLKTEASCPIKTFPQLAEINTQEGLSILLDAK